MTFTLVLTASLNECEDESDAVGVITSGMITGTTASATSDLAGSCGASGSARDLTFVLPVPGTLSDLHLDTVGTTFDSVLYIRADSCDTSDLDCDDRPGNGNESIDLINVEAGVYLVVVDGYLSASGNFVLNVQGTLESGATCDPASEASGLFVCPESEACQGAPGAETCQEAACSNSADDDMDGDSDWPNDPGCSSPSDTDETGPSCPAGGVGVCPACFDGSDNDGDGLMDYPADPGCLGAGDASEIDECIPGVEATQLTNTGTSGTVPPNSAGSNFKGSCTAANSPEVVYVYRVEAPGLNSLTFTTATASSSDDTVLYVRKDDCDSAGAQVGCINQEGGGESLTLTPAQPGFYYVFVDGDFDSGFNFDLSVAGVLAVGAPCGADPNFTCPLGTTCTMGTCQP